MDIAALDNSTTSTPAEVEGLVAQARDLISASRAESTRRAYRSSQQSFENFCAEHNFTALPAESATVALYLTHLFKERNLKPSTVQRHASAISVWHGEKGLPSPVGHPAVKDLLSGVRRTTIHEADQKEAIGTNELKRLIAKLDNSPSGIRNKALLLTGFVGGLRRSEIVAINIGDITHRPEGITIKIKRSKTDQEGKGRSVALPYSAQQELCPVLAITALIELNDSTRGPLFRRIRRGGNIGNERLTPQSVALVIKTTAHSAGLDPATLSGHSLRRGFVTTAARNGASERAIQRQTGHRSTAVLRSYIEHETAFDDNAAADLGL